MVVAVVCGARRTKIYNGREVSINMPKMKTHKGTAKRLSQSANGLIMHRHPRRMHSQMKKTGSRLRALYLEAPLYPGKKKHVKRQLPYGAPN